MEPKEYKSTDEDTGYLPKISKQAKSSENVSIHCIPNEILEYIFSFLTIVQRFQIERVCKRWRQIGRKWQFPSALCIDIYGKEQNNMCTLSCLFNRRNTSAGQFTRSADRIVLDILSRCGSSVKHLTFSDKNMRLDRIVIFWFSSLMTIFANISTYCPNLVELKFCNFKAELFNCMTETLQIFEEKCPKLRLVYCHCKVTGTKSSSYLLQYVDQLPSTAAFSFRKSRDSFDSISVYLYLEFIPSHQRSCRNRRYTRSEMVAVACRVEEHLPSFKVEGPDNSITDALKLFNLNSYFQNDSPENIVLMAKLQELDVAYLKCINDEFCLCLSRNCSNLTKLNVRGTRITEVGFKYLASVGKLTDIDVSCTNITGDGIENFALTGRLERLIARYCYEVTEDSRCFYLVIRFCPNLRILVVNDTKSISEEFVEACCEAVQNGFFKSSLSVSLDQCETLNRDLFGGKLRISTCLYLDDDLFYI